MRRIRSHLTYANVMVTLLAFVVLAGGAAYAANTIGSADIIDGQVKTPDLANNAVRTGKVLDESLTGHDIQDNTIGGADVNESLLDPLTNAQIMDESLTGHDIQNNTIGGADVNESLLDGVAYTPSFASWNPIDFDLPADGSFAQVIYTGDGVHNDSMIHVRDQGTVMASATLNFIQDEEFAQLTCALGLVKPGDLTQIPFGQPARQDLEAWAGGAARRYTISLSGGTSVSEPGDYFVNVVCKSDNRDPSSGGDRARFDDGNLIAWAT